MPKKSTREKFVGKYFTWIFFERAGVWYADGRSNQPSPGRHSLGTKERIVAVDAVRKLDVVRAVDLGLADRRELDPETPAALTLEAGWELYRSHVSRARIAGGAKPSSVKRYRPVFEKFIPFAREIGVTIWNRVTTGVVENYASWLDGKGYAYKTECLELTTIKQCANWLRKSGHLVNLPVIELSLRKPTGTDTYCWKPEEFAVIVAHCRAYADLHWLGDVVTALATTGLRISELASLRTTDLDLVANVIKLTDETTLSSARTVGRPRTAGAGVSPSPSSCGQFLSDFLLRQTGSCSMDLAAVDSSQILSATS